MERNKYLKEIEKVLDQLSEHENEVKKMFSNAEGELNMQVYRYQSKKGEKTYENLLRVRKIKNLIDYLLLLVENKNK